MGSITQAWVDGSCLNNGVSGASSAIGVYYGPEDPRNFSSKLSGPKQTNNKAELLAVLYVLSTNLLTSDLKVHTDSQYSIKCLTEYHHKWRLNGWVTSKGDVVESVGIIKYALDLLTRRSAMGSCTELCYVKGHADNVGNNAADRLANAAAHSAVERGRIKLLCHFGVPF